jgi:hypothetical protein
MIMVNTHGARRGSARRHGPAVGHQSARYRRPSKDGTLILTSAPRRHGRRQAAREEDRRQTVPDGWLLDSDGNRQTTRTRLYGTPPGTILLMEVIRRTRASACADDRSLAAHSGGVTIREKPINQNGNCVIRVRWEAPTTSAAEVNQPPNSSAAAPARPTAKRFYCRRPGRAPRGTHEERARWMTELEINSSRWRISWRGGVS